MVNKDVAPHKKVIKHSVIWWLVGLACVISLAATAWFYFEQRYLNFSLTPPIPSLAEYHAVGKNTIPAQASKARAALEQHIAKAEMELPGLHQQGRNIIDGCGLFVTERNGDFAKSVGKACSLNMQVFYTSSEESAIVQNKLSAWIRPTLKEKSDHMFNRAPCGSYWIGDRSTVYGTLQEIVIVDEKVPSDASLCLDIETIAAPPAQISPSGELAGYDGNYIDIRSQSYVDTKVLRETLTSDITKTVVVMYWSDIYFKE